MIKLIALDLDGTVFSEDLVIAPEDRAAISVAQRRGAHVTLASGRMVRSVRPIATDLKIDTPVICYQGSVLYDLQAGKFLLHYKLERDHALQVIDFIQSHGVFCNAYINDNLYVAEMNPGTEFYASLSAGTPVNVVGDLHEFVAAAPEGPTKLSTVLAEESATDAIVAAVQERFGSLVYAVKSHKRIAEVVNPAANKAVALAALAAHLGVRQEETMAVGDGMNDLAMLEWAGIGVAMGQAREPVKAAADYVTGSIFEHGLAQAIQRFAL